MPMERIIGCYCSAFFSGHSVFSSEVVSDLAINLSVASESTFKLVITLQ